MVANSLFKVPQNRGIENGESYVCIYFIYIMVFKESVPYNAQKSNTNGQKSALKPAFLFGFYKIHPPHLDNITTLLRMRKRKCKMQNAKRKIEER